MQLALFLCVGPSKPPRARWLSPCGCPQAGSASEARCVGPLGREGAVQTQQIVPSALATSLCAAPKHVALGEEWKVFSQGVSVATRRNAL